MKMLRAKLYEQMQQERKDSLKELGGEKKRLHGDRKFVIMCSNPIRW